MHLRDCSTNADMAALLSSPPLATSASILWRDAASARTRASRCFAESLEAWRSEERTLLLAAAA